MPRDLPPDSSFGFWELNDGLRPAGRVAVGGLASGESVTSASVDDIQALLDLSADDAAIDGSLGFQPSLTTTQDSFQATPSSATGASSVETPSTDAHASDFASNIATSDIDLHVLPMGGGAVPALSAQHLTESGAGAIFSAVQMDAPASLVIANLQTPSVPAALNLASGAQAPTMAVLDQSAHVGLVAANVASDASASAATSLSAFISQAHLDNPTGDSLDGATNSGAIGPHGATAAQVQQALGEGGINVNGAGIKVGVLSDSFNDLGGAAADEASGALPSASNVQVIKDLASGGTDEGRAMMQIVHDVAPGASLAFYTADNSEQDFANGILALAAAGCKVICDDVTYFDEPFFQNGVIAQAIQTVEAEGVTFVSSAGNDASNAYQAAWTPGAGSFDGWAFNDAELFGGSLAQTITVTASSANPVPLLLEWNKAYGHASFAFGQAPDIDLFVFHNGTLIAQATNASVGEPNNPWTGYEFTASGTYQIVIANNFGPDPGLIKEILAGDGLPVSISGANAGTVFGHHMTPGVITAGAVSTAATPAFGVSPAASESFSSSGAGTEILFANDGTALSSPELLSPVVVSSVDNISTTVPGGLSDFYGTSAASASLAGVAALILAANPNLTPAQVEQIMQETALPMSNSAVSGAGLVQAAAAAAAAEAIGATIVESLGATSLVRVGPHDFLDPVGGGIGPELKFGGAPVVAGEFGTFVALGAELTATGYDVAWKDTASGLYTAWSTDGNGNYIANIIGDVPGTSIDLETLETALHQDLNGDGSIGPVMTTLESFGSTALAQLGNNYFLNPTAGGTGPELMYKGAAVFAGEFGTFTPIGAEQTATGYDVAWKDPTNGTFTVWTTDSSGNYVSNLFAPVAGNSAALENLEATFHQDLNGDGTIGPVVTTVEAFGTTALAQAGDNYFLNPVAGGTGPELMYKGAVVFAGEFGTFTPIGAEQTATGYDVAWKDPTSGTYTVWTTDSAGNYTSNLFAPVSGNSAALENLEVTFHQDLNGDGTIGPVVTTVEAFGTTALAQADSNYFLNPVAGGAGPELMYKGAAVFTGEFGTFTPIGAEQTATGYDVAWKDPTNGTYTVWTTDSSGNYVSNLFAPVPGNSAALENLEATFHQDLNGDGTIGPVVTTVEAFGSTALAQVGNNYFLNPVAGGTGPELMYKGAAVFAGEFGTFTPIGAEQTATGYDVAWKDPTNGTYTVWTTDSAGNYTSNLFAPVSGNSAALENLEATFHQDLNGDGVIGVPAAAALKVASMASPSTASALGSTSFIWPADTGVHNFNFVGGRQGAPFGFTDLAALWRESPVASEYAIVPEAGHDIALFYEASHPLLAHHDGFQLI